MHSDDLAIRQLVDRWLQATAQGDLPQVLALMADDVVFLSAGRPPMRGKSGFAAGFEQLARTHRIESTSEIQEIEIAGDLAYCWNQLSVSIIPLHSGSPQHKSGPALMILRKQADGRWLVIRDANMLAAN